MTGATGGIGRTLVPVLAAQGAEVVASGRNAVIGQALEGTGVSFQPADLGCDDLHGLVRGVSCIVHLAARSSPWGAGPAFQADNVHATSRLLDAAAAAGVQRFVYASTPTIFAERCHRLDLRGDALPAPQPVNAYARTKLAAERLILLDRRLATLVLRPSAVIGPDDRAILPRLLRVLRRGILPLGNSGTALFHPTDVRDAAAAFAAGVFGSAEGVANIAGREPVRVIDMAHALAARLNLAVRIRHVPEKLLHALAATAELWGLATGREPPLTRYTAATLSWSRTFDLSDAAALLDWRPAFGAAEALAHALPS